MDLKFIDNQYDLKGEYKNDGWKLFINNDKDSIKIVKGIKYECFGIWSKRN